MSNNAAPDSWEEADEANSSASDLQQKLIKQLNVNAVEFIPSFASFSAKSNDDDHDRVADIKEDKTSGDKKPIISKCICLEVMTCHF